MHFHSTNKKSQGFSLSEVLERGLAPDGGLFMPNTWPALPKVFFRRITKLDFNAIALFVAQKFIGTVPRKTLQNIVRASFTFRVPLKHVERNIYILELFHGPTMAFKDFGARFLSRTLSYFLDKKSGVQKTINIIVATSGDTGSAVASGFFKVPNVRVFILYPSRKVSRLQEKQLTTYGHNIVALEVKGSFDDCQKLAKQALGDRSLNAEMRLSSANSINFGRLLPQSFYYFWAYAQLQKMGMNRNPIFVVPSGNFGNLFAGLLAKRIGLPVYRFVAATNANNSVPHYLKSGSYRPKKSKRTISNAMDVGNPSNFARMLELYGKSRAKMAKDIQGISVTDSETKKMIKSVFDTAGYVADPHTAVGICAARKMASRYSDRPIVVLSTAHPAKFREVVEPIIHKKLSLPKQLQAPMKKKKKSLVIDADFNALKSVLLTEGQKS